MQAGGEHMSVTTIIGAKDGASGEYVLSGGLHAARRLIVAAGSRYEIAGGELAVEDLFEGTLFVSGGTLVAEGGAQSAPDEIDFDGPGSVLNTDGLIDLSETLVVNHSGASITHSGDGIMFVSPAIRDADVAGTITITAFDQPYGVAGEITTIDQHSVVIAGNVEHMIEVTGSGSLAATAGESLSLQGGVIWTGTGDLDVGVSGGIGIGPDNVAESVIAPAVSSYSLPNQLLVLTCGELLMSGTVELGTRGGGANNVLNVGGRLSIGPAIDTLELVGDPGTNLEPADPSRLELITQDPLQPAQLVIDVTPTAADQVTADRVILADADLVVEISAAIAGGGAMNGIAFEVLVANDTTFGVVGSFDEAQVSIDGVVQSVRLVNADGDPVGDLDGTDFSLIVRYAGDTLTGSGTVPVGSIFVQSALPGDANLDGIVDVIDLDILGQNYDDPGPWRWDDGDFTGDGLVDLVDFDLLGNYFGAAWSGGSSSIPEPGSLLMMSLAACCLAAVGRDRVARWPKPLRERRGGWPR